MSNEASMQSENSSRGEPRWKHFRNKRFRENVEVANKNLKKKIEDFTNADVEEIIKGLVEFTSRKKKQWYGEYFAKIGISGRKFRYLRENFKDLDEAIELAETALEAYWVNVPFRKPALAKHCSDLRSAVLGEGALVLNWKGEQGGSVGIHLSNIFGGLEAKPIIEVKENEEEAEGKVDDKEKIYLMEPETAAPRQAQIEMDVSGYDKDQTLPVEIFSVPGYSKKDYAIGEKSFSAVERSQEISLNATEENNFSREKKNSKKDLSDPLKKESNANKHVNKKKSNVSKLKKLRKFTIGNNNDFTSSDTTKF